MFRLKTRGFFQNLSLWEKYLAIMVMIIFLQTLLVLGLSLYKALQYIWIGSAILFIGALVESLYIWRNAKAKEKEEIKEAWQWACPWIVIFLFMMHISFFSVTMNDSLSYRMPRIYMWLQEGCVKILDVPDWRMNEMPWGWECQAMPFLSVGLFGAARIINIFVWIILYQTLYQIVKLYTNDIQKRRWVSIALACSPGFILQGSSTANDLYATTLILVATYFAKCFNFSKKPAQVYLSLLALLLATNAKPQFLVLGLLWGCWWLFDTHKPYKKVNLIQLLYVAPIFTLGSAMPKIIENVRYGSHVLDIKNGTDSKFIKCAVGVLQFLITQLQLPFMPGIGKMNIVIDSTNLVNAIQQQVPKFVPGWTELFIIDNASYGLIHFSIIVAGLIIGCRNSNKKSRAVLVLTIACALIAFSQASASTLGRSFMGFLAPLFPLAMIGLVKGNGIFKFKVCFAIGVFALVLNPSAPLWPSSILQHQLEKVNNRVAKKISIQLGVYNKYRERANVGKNILENVPKGEEVGVLLRQITPITNLWLPNWKKNKIQFIQNLSPEKTKGLGIHWILISDNAEEQFPIQYKEYTQVLQNWQLVDHKVFQPTLQKGNENWRLYKLP